MTRRRLSVALVVLVLLGTPWADAAAQTTEQVAELRQRAEESDAFAQYLLGVGYRTGEGVPQDYTEAVRWFRLAVDQDLARAQFAIGLAYGNGQGVPQDYVEAVRWHRLAGSGFSFRVDQEDPCRGTFNSNASIQSSQEMRRSYVGSDCNGIIQATFTATKR